MDETDLLRRLRDEEADATSYHSSELANEQTTALERYFGRPFGTEKADRSQVVTPDVMDAINWALPGMLRPFLSSEDFLTVDTKAGFDTAVAADYLSHIFFTDNPGQQILHDYAFDGMTTKVGIIKTCWEDPEPKPPRELTGVSPEQLLKYWQDEEYEILEVALDGELEDQRESEQNPEEGGEDEGYDENAEEPDEANRPQTFTIKVQHTPSHGRVYVECVAPEDFRIARRATTISNAQYHAVIHRNMLLADVFRQFPDKKGDIEFAANDNNQNEDTRIQVRFTGESVRTVKDVQGDIGRGRVDLMQEYVRGDFDGDGAEELRAVKRIGSVILENIVIDEPEVSIWSPIKVAHRAIGLSLADTVIPYQKIATEITRRALDNMAQVLVPQKVISVDALDEGNIANVQSLINGDIGATALVRGKAGDAVAHIQTPDVSGSALAALQHFDQRKQEASGVTAHMQGAEAQKLHDTAQGVDLIQSAGNSRIELMARWFAEGLEAVFNRILKLICQHQDQVRIVKLRGKPMEVNPSMWPDDMMVRVHVGMAASSRERQIANLSAILSAQKEIMMQMGPSNPIVGVPELRNSLARLVEAMGYKDATAFFKEVPQNYQPPEPGKDPKQVEAEGKIALANAESQAKLAQAQGEAQAKLQLDRERAQFEAQLAREKAQAEIQLARERMVEEFKLKAMEAQMNAETQRMLGAHKNTINGANDAANLPDNRPGGKLDA